jgi:site-specific DNA-methyltransferase (adenine-specific)
MFHFGDSTKIISKVFGKNTIDAIITDPPYGIDGSSFDKYYNRDDTKVIKGYIDVQASEYLNFSNKWMTHSYNVLKENGHLVVISGWSNLIDIMESLNACGFHVRNHVVWKYNFGVYTKMKFVSSHYHIIIASKKKRRPLNIPSVLYIKREYHHDEVRNVNQLPSRLLRYLIDLVSKPGDSIMDPFLGSFSTAVVGHLMKRNVAGIELNKTAYQHGKKNFKNKVFSLTLKGIDDIQNEKRLTSITKKLYDKSVFKNEQPTSDVSCCILYTWWKLSKNDCVSKINGIYNILNAETNVFIICNNIALQSWLAAIKQSDFICVNHIIWHHMSKRAVDDWETYTHVLWLNKGKKWYFKRDAFYNDDATDENDKSLNYMDREDVWEIPCKTLDGTLPYDLIKKILLYTTRENDIVWVSKTCTEIKKYCKRLHRKTL